MGDQSPSAAGRDDTASTTPPTTKVFVVFYSSWGHTYRLAEAIAEGARSSSCARATLWQVKPNRSDDALKRSGAFDARRAFAHVPVIEPDALAEADAIVFGTPTEFGGASASLTDFFSRLGSAWSRHEFVGKVGAAFSSTGTQHGGHETTILDLHRRMLHLGMVIVGLPYSCAEQLEQVEITGGSPYGAGTIAGNDNRREPTANELAIARFHGRHVAAVAARLTQWSLP